MKINHLLQEIRLSSRRLCHLPSRGQGVIIIQQISITPLPEMAMRGRRPFATRVPALLERGGRRVGPRVVNGELVPVLGRLPRMGRRLGTFLRLLEERGGQVPESHRDLLGDVVILGPDDSVEQFVQLSFGIGPNVDDLVVGAFLLDHVLVLLLGHRRFF